MRTRKRTWFAIAVVLTVALAVLGAACGGGGGDDDAAEVEAAIRAAADAWNGKDVDALLALLTDNFISEELEGATREQASEGLQAFIGEPPFTITAISEVDVSGDTATAVIDSTEGKLLRRERGSLVRQEDAWLLDSFDDIGADIPADATAVDLTATEYMFTFDESATTSGNIAFNVSNIGGEQHFVDIAKVPEDLDIEQALRSEEEPPGVEEIGGTDPLDPGSDTTIVFTEPLEPGRYVMVCFIEAADGEPHALKGMWAEFTIE